MSDNTSLPSPASGPGPQDQSPAHFVTTLWNVVLVAGGNSSPESAAALETLCRTYWYPIYAFLRRQGRTPHDSQDLTQAFFARLLEKHGLGKVSPEKGKFRSFLLASLKNFVADEWDKLQAKKRGGGQITISLDAQSAEDRYAAEPVERLDPEKIYERRWAMTILDEVMAQLQATYAARGRQNTFDALHPFLLDRRNDASYAQVGKSLNMTERAVKTEVYRMRQRWRDLLRDEIAKTLSAPDEMDEEMRHLFRAIGD